MNELERKVVAVVQSGEIAGVREDIADIRQKIENQPVPVLKRRPKVTAFFVGRDSKLDKIRIILYDFGSAAVTNYGCVGKTQLATAFADRAEKKGWVRGGEKPDAIESVAEFTESLTRRSLGEKVRVHLRAVVSELRGKLEMIKGRWLVCVDNADDAAVNPVFEELANLAEFAGGWVIVTSRQGSETLWDKMVAEQKVSLKPMNRNDAMVTLMRRKKKLLSARVSNAEVEERVKQLETQDPVEYNALCDLASEKEECGMAGLPLALVQTGSFMNKKKMSFAVYLKLYTTERNSPDVQRLLLKAEETGLEDPRKQTVLNIWKISTDSLSELARSVLGPFALFDSQPVPRTLVRRLDSNFCDVELMYDEVVEGELVDGISRLQEAETETESCYQMHQLRHQFITLGTREDESCFRETWARAINALHYCTADALSSTGDSFSWPPNDHYSQLSRNILPHTNKVLIMFPSTSSNEKFSMDSKSSEVRFGHECNIWDEQWMRGRSLVIGFDY